MDGSQLLKGALPAVTLAVVAEGDTYGYEVVSRLRDSGLAGVGDASVYGTLQRLFESGAVASYMARSSAGPNRRYYAITPRGLDELKVFRDQWREFQIVISGLLAEQREAGGI